MASARRTGKLSKAERSWSVKTSVGLAFAVIMLFQVLLVVPDSEPQDKTQAAIKVNGAAMAANDVELWTKSFMDSNPDVKVVVSGTSAGKGFQALLEGQADLALMSREVSEEEQKKAAAKGLKFTSKLIGYSGLAVITSPRNPVNELTFEQLKKIYLGEYTNWKQVGGPDAAIRYLTRRVPESGGAVFFQQEVLHKEPFGPNAAFTENWTSIARICSSATDFPIGIVPAVLAKEGVKVLALKKDENSAAVAASPATVKDKSYPLIVPITIFWNSESRDARIEKVVNFYAATGLL
jgi:phosphate transport system substrate-binding protein